MRFLFIIATIIYLCPPLAFANSAAFDEFINGREVVTTLYFQSNNEDLSNSERKRLSATINKLRELQNNGRMIRVEGFSSPEGDRENNFRLSFFRARSVADLIETKGLPAEVVLTGYGDLRARSDDPTKERRVEIASYPQPAGMKRIKVADKKEKKIAVPSNGVSTVPVDPKDQEIDSYRVDQAIRMKVDDKDKDIADRIKIIEERSSPGLSKTKKKVDDADDLDRGYSHWRKSVDPSSSPKLSQSQDAAEREMKRGYSQWKKSVDPEVSPGVTLVTPVEMPAIDALMIEQAIMEKIGAVSSPASNAVSQIGAVYYQ